MHNHQTTPLQNQKRTKKQLKKSISQNELMSTHCYLQHQQQLEWESARSQLWVRRKINFDMQEHLADFKGAFPLNNAQRNFSPFSKKLTILNNWACATNKITLSVTSLSDIFLWYCCGNASLDAPQIKQRNLYLHSRVFFFSRRL